MNYIVLPISAPETCPPAKAFASTNVSQSLMICGESMPICAFHISFHILGAWYAETYSLSTCVSVICCTCTTGKLAKHLALNAIISLNGGRPSMLRFSITQLSTPMSACSTGSCLTLSSISLLSIRCWTNGVQSHLVCAAKKYSCRLILSDSVLGNLCAWQ